MTTIMTAIAIPAAAPPLKPSSSSDSASVASEGSLSRIVRTCYLSCEEVSKYIIEKVVA